MTNINLGKWQSGKKYSCIKRDNEIANKRQGVFTPHTSICMHQAYKPHTWDNGHSSTLNSRILGQVQAAKLLIPID